VPGYFGHPAALNRIGAEQEGIQDMDRIEWALRERTDPLERLE
jgi:hypothetical protein